MPIVTEDTTAAGTDGAYDAFLSRLRVGFVARVGAGAVFETDACDLFPAYLDALPDELRQHHVCHACRHFVERFGSLVVIAKDGTTMPALWHAGEAPPLQEAAFGAMERLVRRATVKGPFLSNESVWGTPVTGPWHHMALVPPSHLVLARRTITAQQVMAEKREDYGSVARGLAEFSADAIAQAITLLKTDSLYRSEKCLGVAEWLAELHRARGAAKGKKQRDNVLWRAVASAPPGYCHPRTSMIGSLLEDITAGLPFADVKRKFDAKMHPLQYQRPQAAPSAGNIAQAEKLVEQLGIAPSLRRRFARLDEIEAIWRHRERDASPPRDGGVFSHLTPKGATPSPSSIVPPPMVMTWDKFLRTVLPGAESIQFFVPYGMVNFSAMVTAADETAPPILQWDREDRRNPFSCYVWNGGSPAAQWGLRAGAFAKVNALTMNPARWFDGGNSHHGETVLFVLDGARESRTDAGLALFPETLKSDLHAVRATIEAFSRKGKLEGEEEASVCGIALHKNARWDALLRVTAGGSVLDYKLDRWD